MFKSDRSFSVQGYVEGHGMLLLRSRRTHDFTTTIEILFNDVRAMEIRMWFRGLRITEVDPTALRNRETKPLELFDLENKVYQLESENWSGFILGGMMWVHEGEPRYAKVLDPNWLWSTDGSSIPPSPTPK